MLERYKAKLVAMGFTKKEEAGFNEVFSPAVKRRSIQILLSMEENFDLKIEGFVVDPVVMIEKYKSKNLSTLIMRVVRILEILFLDVFTMLGITISRKVKL